MTVPLGSLYKYMKDKQTKGNTNLFIMILLRKKRGSLLLPALRLESASGHNLTWIIQLDFMFFIEQGKINVSF